MTTWKYVDNQFEVNTRRSYKKAVILSNYHHANLKKRKDTEPLYKPIFDRYEPLHLALVEEYNAWRSAGGAQQGQTLSLEQQLAIAYDKVDIWDVAIQVVHRKNTPTYKAIFPNGRKPFTRGFLDDRINSFDTLAKNIGSDAALASIKTEVEAAFTLLDSIRDTQASAKGSFKNGSGLVDKARVTAMNMQYRNACFVMDNFFETRGKECKIIFDLPTLRESDQSNFTITLDAAETAAILIHTFLADDQLKCKLDGKGTVKLFLATTASGTDSTAVILDSVTEVIIPIAAFGDIPLSTHRFLTAVSEADGITKLRVVLD